jgi:hypothetical protein
MGDGRCARLLCTAADDADGARSRRLVLLLPRSYLSKDEARAIELRYKALLRENERLRSLLADTAKEHRLRKVHRIELVRRRSSHPSRNIA